MTTARAWGWLAHLRAGGTTPWSAWSADGDPDGRFPGAQQLELLRRLNALGPASRAFADRVLTSAGPGRGHQDLSLIGDDLRAFGAAPVDPVAVPADELVRLATGVLADLVVEEPRHPVRRRPRRVARPGYLLDGDPWLGRSARIQLTDQGRPPGGRRLGGRPRALVVLAPIDVYCADVWGALSIDYAMPRWTTWLDRLDRGSPRHADPTAAAATLAARVGHDRVHLCLGLPAVAELLGTSIDVPEPLSHAALETIRLVRAVLRIDVGDPTARMLVDDTLLPWLGAADDAELPGPGVPRQHLPWLRDEAERWQRELAGYAVHGGSLDSLAPAEPARTLPPDDDEVLRVMLRTLSRLDDAR